MSLFTGRPLLAALILLSAALTALVAPAAAAGNARADLNTAAGVRGRAQPGVIRDLAIAYAATARFHRLERAIAAGYPEDATGCLDFPNGYMSFGPGAMTTHWINFDYFDDGGALDVAHPEALLYEPQADGSMRLIAVEYIVPESDLPRTAPPPVLFGREMLFHPQFGVWGTHVWLWKYNPYGLFADVNPRAGCEFADRVGDATSHSHP